MKLRRSVIVSLAALALAATLVAQQKPGTIAGLEFQRPKNGMTKQYDEGRKQKAAWHKQQKDTQALYVWEVIAGDNFGTYVVGRLGNHWKDLDTPSVPDGADLAIYDKSIGPYVESVVARYYSYLPNISRPADSTEMPAMSEIIIFRVRYGKTGEFMNLARKINDAIGKSNWAVRYSWFALVAGGHAPTFVLSIPRNKWADFEEPEKSLDKILEEVYGKQEASEIFAGLGRVVESEETEIVKFRADLSYIPAK